MSCDCGACKTCRQRKWQRTWRGKNREYHNAYVAAWTREKRAQGEPEEHAIITLDDAEQMDMEAWLRLPEQIKQHIVTLYLSERAQQ